MMEWQLTVSSVSLLYASIVCNVFSLKDKLRVATHLVGANLRVDAIQLHVVEILDRVVSVL